MIELSDDEFRAIEEALEFAHSGWGAEEVEQLALLELKAFDVVRQVRARVGSSE